MKKVGICGYFAEGDKGWGGQLVKTKTIAVELANRLGTDEAKTVDTYNWKKNKIVLISQCFDLARTCKNIIILPGKNGLIVFSQLFLTLNKLYHRQIHYIVIGGWLNGVLADNEKLKKRVGQFAGVYVETYSMVKALEDLGLKNVRYFPNFKRLDIIEESDLVYPKEEPYKLCTFSRVTKEKGIEDAVNAVSRINDHFGREVYTLDIYGPVDESYQGRFEEIKINFPDYISYKGAINANDSVKTLKNYFALLFPTYYEGEGFAGTILDAYASGIPVIATNWKYNCEIIHDRSDGFIYDHKNMNGLESILEELQNKNDIIISMKKNCLKRANEYLPEVVIEEFIKHLK